MIGGLWAAASNATWPPIEAPTSARRSRSTSGRLASQSIAASTSSGWRRPLVAFAPRSQPAAQRQRERRIAVGRGRPRQPHHGVGVAGKAVQQDQRRVGWLARLRLEEVAAQRDAMAGHAHLFGVGEVGQLVPAVDDLDRHAVGIAEADRVVARCEVVEFLGRLQDLGAGVAQLDMDLVDLGAALGRHGEPEGTRPVGDAVLGLAHDEMVIAARPHHAIGVRPDTAETQHRQPQPVERHRACEVAHLDRGAGERRAWPHQDD